MSNKRKYNSIIYQDSEITKFIIDSIKYGKFEVMIDTKNWDKVKDYKWHISFNKKWNTYYIQHTYVKNNKYNSVFIHKIIMGNMNKQIDHIDGNRLNNTEKNLRYCNNIKNGQNRKIGKNNTSGYKGVQLLKNKYWISNIKVNKKNIYLGSYKNSIDAAIAYNNAAKKYFGEFARINII